MWLFLYIIKVEALEKEKFFIMIGGDHSVTIPVQAAIDESVSDDFGIIHIDAHFDLCDYMGGDKLSHLSKIYITLDIDCLDPAYAAGTGTPQFGGLTSRELLTILEGLFDLPIIGMDIVEVSPKLDPSLTSLFAARKIVTEVCGFVSKKM